MSSSAAIGSRPVHTDARLYIPAPPTDVRPSADTRLADHVATVPDTPEAQARLQRFLQERAPATPTGTAVTTVAAAATATGIDAARQTAMDGFRRSLEGPYHVDGHSIAAPPMFRLNVRDAFNAEEARKNRKDLHAICTKAGISAAVLARCEIGRASPRELVKVTQALVDFTTTPRPTSAEQIRQMQWHFGIGLDCVGYSRQAAAVAFGSAGAAAFRYRADDGMAHTVSNGHFQRQSAPIHARTGDLFCLTSPQKGQPGHNVCVYSHRIVGAGAALGQLAGNAAAARFAAGPGPVHAFDVDSSWGADDGHAYGGVRRDTWLFDESSKTWAWLNPRTAQLETSTRGPQGENFAGAYRPRGVS